MSTRTLFLGLAICGGTAFGAAAVFGGRSDGPDAFPTGAPADAPVRLIVENRTLSALIIFMAQPDGEERRLGQAPPDFSNTLFVSEPLPAGAVRFLARLAGEDDVLYRSRALVLSAGAGIRWRLPANSIDG